MFLLFTVLLLSVAINIPTSNILGNGFDFKSGTYGLAPIFKFTYKGGKTWTTPFSGITYNVPDQFVFHSVDKTFESVIQHVSVSYTEFYEKFVEEYSFSIGIDIGIVGFGFNFDQQLGHIRDLIRENYVEFLHGTHNWQFAVGAMYPPELLNFDPMFALSLEKFPQKIITKNDKMYATEFTQTFGQFFAYRAEFGAKLDFNSAVTETIVKSYSIDWIFTQTGFTFHYYLFNISAGGFSNRTDIHISDIFVLNSNANSTFYGGDPSLANLGNLTKWVDSIDRNLYPLNTTFVPIWTLVSDSVKRQTMMDFMLEYLHKSDLV